MKRLFALLLLLPLVAGLGATPATIHVNEDDTVAAVTLVSDRPVRAGLQIHGPLSKVIDHPRTVMITNRKRVNLSFRAYDHPPGVTTSTLHVTAAKADANIGARAGVQVPIRVTAPRNGTHLEGRFLSTTLRPGQEGTIPFEITNRGNVTTTVTASLSIHNSTVDERTTVPGIDTATIGFPIAVSAGTYTATVTVRNRSYQRQYTVGSPRVFVKNITVTSFDPLRLTTTLVNDWSAARTLAPSLIIGEDRFPAQTQTLQPRTAGIFTFQPELEPGGYTARLRTANTTHTFTMNISDDHVTIAGTTHERGYNTVLIGVVLASILFIAAGLWVSTER